MEGTTMKKHTYLHYYFIFLTVMLSMMISAADVIIDEAEKEPTPIVFEEPIEPLWNRQLIVEKEVIVYVEKEPEPVEVAAEPVVYYQQPLDYSFDITVPSGYTVEDLERSLGGIRQGMLSSLPAIVEAEQIYGINSLYLLATLGYESGWGSHESGLNNIAGWKNEYGGWKDFDSRYQCIMTVAEGLANDFVYDVGSDIKNITDRYTPDVGYVDLLLQIMGELQINI